MRRLRDISAGLAFAALLFCALEAGLALLGLGDSSGSDLERGFRADAAYLVPAAGGGFRTQYFDGTKPELSIPPKSAAKRVLLFGGSNTAGFPAPRLEKELNRDEAGRFEVFNLGRSGYGSARVAILFRQALELLEPDVVVLYTGHNEFVEKGFRLDLDESLGSGWTKEAARTARVLRTFQILTRWVRDDDAGGPPKPEAWRGEFAKFKNQTREEMLAQFDAYRENVEGMCALARERGVGVLLSTVIYNRVSAPRVSVLPEGLKAAERDRFEAAFSAAKEHLPERLRPLFAIRGEERLHGFDWSPSETTCTVELTIPRILARNPKLVPIDTWNPKVPRLLNAYDGWLGRETNDAERRELESASTHLDEALAIAPEYPEALYLRGLVDQVLVSPESARTPLEDAARFDRVPRKATERSNGILAEIAAGASEVLFFDADEEFRALTPDGVVGWDWMVDHCHLGAGARVQLMEMFSREIRARW